MGCLEMILILIAIGWVIGILIFLWAWSPFTAILVMTASIVILYYVHKWFTNTTYGTMTQRTCPKCGELNQSRQENLDWNCFKCGTFIPKKVKCPDCGKSTIGTVTENGVKAALCPDCYDTLNKKQEAEDNIEENMELESEDPDEQDK